MGVQVYILLFVVAWVNGNVPDDSVSVAEFTYKSPVPAGPVFFAENFDDEDYFRSRWVRSEAKKEGAEADIAKYDGQVMVEPVENEAHRLKGDLGMVLKSKAKHYAIAAPLDRPFVFDNRPLIVQYEVHFQNGMECGGAYLKLLTRPDVSSILDQLKSFNDKSLYSIMFGPDKCGTQHKLHFIFQYKNPKTGAFEEKHWKNVNNAGSAMGGKFSEVFSDKKPHQYMLSLYPDNTFEIQIDSRVEAKGHMLADFEPPVNPPKEIEDVNDKKPIDWDEREKIPDPDAQKPEDWDETEPDRISDPTAEKPIGWLDSEPLLIPDPEASRPLDWDEDMDGVWEAPLVDNPKCKDVGCGEWKAPLISNPKYKGKWRAPTIDNPAYKGKWKPRRIPNPDYFEDLNPFRLQPISAVGFELWSMSEGIMFDNLLITDDRAIAAQWSEDGFALKRRILDKGSDSVLNAVFTTFVDYSTQYPWLWAIYVLVVGIPIAFIISYCCMSKSPSNDEIIARRKKRDDTPELDDCDKLDVDQARFSRPGTPGSRSAEASGDDEATLDQIQAHQENLRNDDAVGDGPPEHLARKRKPRKD